jgi:hypothetical protein
MSITSVKSGATGISLALDNNFMEPIATTLVGSTTVNVVTFNDIPQTYKHLQIRAISRRTGSSSSGATDWLRFNGDAGSNYSWHYLQGTGSTAQSGASTSQTRAYSIPQPEGGATASAFGGIVIDILDYTNISKYKTIRSLGGYDLNGDGKVQLNSSVWLNTDAVVQITLGTDSNNFAQYSRFSLYGIKG